MPKLRNAASTGPHLSMSLKMKPMHSHPQNAVWNIAENYNGNLMNISTLPNACFQRFAPIDVGFRLLTND